MKIEDLFLKGSAPSSCSLSVRLRTPKPVAFVDVTKLTESLVRQSKITSGAAIVRTRHTTTAVICTEADPKLHEDVAAVLSILAPNTGIPYRHTIEGVNNARAHIWSVLLGQAVAAPVRENALVLGPWQRLYLVELWDSLERTIDIQILSCETSR